MGCENCDMRKTCVKLCKKARKYADQDYNAESWRKIKPCAHIEQVQMSKMPETATTQEIIVQLYFLDRLTPSEIVEKTFKSKSYVYYVIHKYAKIMRQNLFDTKKPGG